ncbi:hypothetical protein BDR26DRAFT_920224 [Obelidium mucronatum]|nr:hypothetical protein BDR26DRAFT_920224 [Obelidium mucronatum]
MRRYGTMVVAVSSFVVIVIVLLYFVIPSTKSSYFALTPLIVAVALFTTIPTSAKYVRVVETFASKWTQEDESQGINLQYAIKASRPNGQTIIDVKLAIFEKVTFSGVQIVESEGLPTYVK